jgi:ABC-2 type transport system permease protein
MIDGMRAAWILLRRPTILWPAVAGAAIFSVMSIVLLFLTASRPGGSRLTDPPILLETLAGAATPQLVVGRPVMVLGIVVLGIAATHTAGQFSTGSIRLQLLRQPRRSRWLLSTWIVLVIAATALSVLAAGLALGTALICAAIWDVDTGAWFAGGSTLELIAATLNLAVGMSAFAVAGSALAVLFRSAAVTLAVGLVYTLFENLLSSASDFANGLFPVSAFSNVATFGANGGTYSYSLVATIVFISILTLAVNQVFTTRDVTD